jgi:hypothetical protein
VTLKVGYITHFISADGWGRNETNTLCKGEGFQQGLSYRKAMNVDTSKPVLKYRCDGIKASIGECRLTAAAPPTQKYEVAAVLCYNVFSEYKTCLQWFVVDFMKRDRKIQRSLLGAIPDLEKISFCLSTLNFEIFF